jgi:hypothetical protein
MFILNDVHLEAAQEIAKKHRRRRSCDHCYDRGWIGTNEQNLLVLCTHCVDMDAAVAEWKEYVSGHEDLKEHFSELFEEKNVEDAEEERALPNPHEHKKSHLHAEQNFVPGQKKTGRAKKI